VFKVGIKFDLNFYSLGVTFFLSTLWFQIFGNLLNTYFFKFAHFFPSFSQQELPS
jgi:hypothetical protein